MQLTYCLAKNSHVEVNTTRKWLFDLAIVPQIVVLTFWNRGVL